MPVQYCHPQWYSSGTSTNYTITNQQYYYTTASTQTISPNTTWQIWNNSSTLYRPTQTYANEAWVQWTYQPSQFLPETQEQREHREARSREITERRTAAKARARILLGEFLDEGQKVELERRGRFYVTGSKGRRYCIRANGQSGNVDLLKPDGSVQASLCCHPRSIDCELLPDADAWLMQMMEIRHDEENFLRTANVHRGSLAGIR